MEWRQAGPGGLGETIPTPWEGTGRVTPEAELNQTEGRRPKPEASGVPRLEPVPDGLARLDRDVSDRFETLAGFLEREGCRLADARR